MEDYTVEGKCAENCGKCCTAILPLNGYELNKIKKYISRNDIKPDNFDFDMCPFLGENKKCKVYIHRPTICQAFICNDHIKDFVHSDKHMVNMWKEFYPEDSYNIPNDLAKSIDARYQIAKEKTFGKK